MIDTSKMTPEEVRAFWQVRDALWECFERVNRDADAKLAESIKADTSSYLLGKFAGAVDASNILLDILKEQEDTGTVKITRGEEE